MYFDLKIEADGLHPATRNELIKSCIRDGYSGIALNFNHFENMAKIKKCPVDKEKLKAVTNKIIDEMAFKEPNKKKKDFLIFTRISLKITHTKDLVQLRPNNKNLKSYDIVACSTKDDKILHRLCLETQTVDIITFDFKERLIKLKHNILYEAGARGIYFEICYGEALTDSQNRRMALSNFITLSRTLRGKFMLINSGVSSPIYHRSPSDIHSLCDLLDLNSKRILEAISDNMVKVIKRSKLRKMYKGMITVVEEDEEPGDAKIGKRQRGADQGFDEFHKAYKKLKV